jgi:hypothetical protein
MTNAKTYNAPNTIYFKSADKIAKYAQGLFDKEQAKLEAVEEERRKQAEEESEFENIQLSSRFDLGKVDTIEVRAWTSHVKHA